ncbi:MAG: hypothetical protein QXU95_03765 [Candidatus Bathyarchaeia archaeon]
MGCFSGGRDAALSIFVVALVFLGGVVYAAFMVQGAGRGVCVRFVDELDRPLSGVDVYVQVWAVDPNAVPSTVDVYCGRLMGSELFISAGSSAFRRVLEGWNGLYPKDSEYETFLGVFIWVIAGDRVLSYPLVVVSYNPLLASKSIVYRSIMMNVYSMSPEGLMPEWVREAEAMETMEPAASPPTYMYIRDNQLSWESGTYVEVPILIVHNDYAYSGVIGASIGILTSFKVGCRLSAGYGVNIRSKLLNAEIPSPIKFMISNPVRSGYYSFSENLIVPPGVKRYVWISAKVAHIHYREAFAYPDTEEVIYYTGNEMMLDYVYDFQVSGNTINGDVKDGSPPCESLIFGGTVEENLVVSGTVLSDGDLDVDESIQFSQILNCYDVYDVDSEIGLPIGAIIALLSNALGFTGSVATVITAVLSGIAPSISNIDSANAFILGNLRNWGREGTTGYDTYEIIYCRVSKYQYQAPNNQYFKVPVGIYFRCA